MNLKRIASFLGTYMVRVGTTLKDYGDTNPAFPPLDTFEKYHASHTFKPNGVLMSVNAYTRRTGEPKHVAEFMVKSYLEGRRFVS